MLVAPLPFKWRLVGAALGGAYVFAVNQLRIVALFYTVKYDNSLFDVMHGTIAPVTVIVAAAIFVGFWFNKFLAAEE